MNLLSRILGKAARGRSSPMNQHTVAAFDAELKVLAELIDSMGLSAALALRDATQALLKRDTSLAQKVISSDQAIDDFQHQIEERAVATIAKRQPMAIDLREIVSTIRIANDLERIGDLAKNVAKRVVAISDHETPVSLRSGLRSLAGQVDEQLSAVLRAYHDRNDEAALEVWRADNAVDAMFTDLFLELLAYMIENPRGIGFCTHLLFCAKNLERVGDHATNIAEIAHYVVTGDVITAERPKADNSIAANPTLQSSS